MNKYLLPFLFLFLMLNSFFSSATHVVGGELNYRWLGGNNYEIRLTVYRDCINGVPPFDNPASIGIFNSTNNLVNVNYSYTGFYPDPYYNLSPPFYNNATFNNQTYGFLIHPHDSATIPNTITSPCVIPPSNVCYRVCHYIDTITLPPIPGGYHLVYQRCCRNFSIANIVNPLNTGSTYDAWIPAAPNNYDSNPVFNFLPSTYICVNNPFIFDHSATDPEGDSLVYQLCAPLDGASFANSAPQPPNNPPYASVTWQAPYSQANVFGGVPLTINPTTGLLTATPNGTGQFVYAVCVLEYRNGVLIGQTRRDFQVNIVVCANITVASILTSTIPCGSYTASFTNNSTGASTYHWDFGVPSTNADTSNLVSPSYTYPDTGWYHVMLVAFSSINPLCNDTSYGDVYVRPLPVVTVSPNLPICIGQSTVLTAVGTSTSYTWSPATGLSSTTGPSVTASPTSTQTYTVTGTLNGCTATTQVTVTVNPLPVITVPTPPAICVGQQSATLTASGASTYSWTPSTALSATTGSTVTATPTTTTTYTVTGTDINGCTASTQVTVTVNPLPVVTVPPPPAICVGQQSATLTASGASTYSWTPSTALSATTGSTVTATPTTTTTYTVTGTDINGCTATTQVTVTVNPLPVVTVPTPPAICVGQQTATLTASGASTYSWAPSTALSATTGSTVTATPTTTTTYTVTGTDINGCTASTQVTVTVNPLPVITVPTPPAICVGQQTATLTANGASTYSWAPSTALSATTGSTITATPTTTTTYTVTGTDINGCTATTQVTVTVNPLPVVTVPTPPAICVGQQSATLTASGASTYSWTPSTALSATTGATVTATPTSTTTYTVTGTDINGCTASTQVTVTVNLIPMVTVSPDITICIAQSTVLTAAGANTYIWTPATGLSATTGSTVTATPQVTTTYTVTGDALGCTASAQVTVIINSQPNVTVPPVTICFGQSTTLNANGANTYTWSPSTSLSSTIGSSVTANPSSTITYTVVGDLNGCTATTQVTVTVNPLPVITVPTPPAICVGQQSATLTASGASTYSWTPSTALSATTGSTVTATPTTTTTYTVTGTDINGCTASTQVTVTVNPLPVVTVPPPPAICVGQQSATLTASGASTYSWTPSTALSATTGSTVTATPTTTTTYTVTGTDINGCTATTQVTVTVNPLPVVTVPTPPAICVGQQTATLTASGASTYSWAPSTALSATTGSTVTATPTTTTTYTVTGTDINGCTASTQVTVTVNPLPVITVPTPPAICVGQQTATLTANGASTYSWAPSTALSATTGSTITATPTTTTTYTVTGTDINGCTATTQVTVTVNPLPVVTVPTPPAICVGQQSATLTASGASTYSWTPSTALSATTGATVTATPTSTTTYTVTGTDINGCTASTQVTVTVNLIPMVTVSPDITICIAQSTVLTAAGANTYIWTPATGLSATTGSTVTATPQVTTTYTVTGDALGCTASAQVTVIINSQPNVTVPPVTICFGQSTTLNANGANTYTWSPSTSLSSTIGSSVTANPSSTITYTVVGDLNGCTATTQVTVTVNPLPVITVPTPPAICVGQQSATLTASGASTYSWTPSTALSATTGSTVTATPTTTTTYTVTGTDINGCTASTQVTVTVNPLPVVTVPPPPAICVGQQSATLTASGASTYSWTPSTALSATTGSTVTATPTTTTTYTVTGTDINGCTATTQVTVTVNPLPQPAFTFQIASCSRVVTFTNTSLNAISYSWDFGDASTSQLQNPSHTYAVNGNYNVTLIAVSSSGCIDTIVTPVIINYVPVNSVFAYLNTPCSYTFTFSDQSTGANSYNWDFGDASTSGLQNPQHTYSLPGNYTVTLISSDANGCSDTSAQVVSVQPLAQSNFTYQVDTCSLNVTFINNSLNAASYDWDFGDAFTSTLQNPIHTYLSTGNYTVSLIATTSAGCSDTLIVPVPLAFTLPIADFTAANLPCSNTVNFNNQSSSAYTYDWNFGDNNFSTIQNPTHTYALPGNYTITLVAYGIASCSDTATQSVVINNLPTASFVPIIDICALNSAFFNSSGNAATYAWDFGDNSSSTVVNPFHTYSQAGTYTVTLIATDNNGCTDTTSQTIIFPAIAQAAFTFHVDTCIRFVTFSNTSASGISYFWDFGDGNNSTQQNPTHTYASNNNYNVTLIVTGSTGCSDTLVIPVPVFFIPPVAGFTDAIPLCTRTANFTNQSSLATNYNWNFGDNSFSSLVNPTHDYQQPGNYAVTLIASTPDGCADTTVNPVIINPLPAAGYTSFVDTCSLNASFNNTSQYATSYFWNFGDNTFSNSPNPAHIYAAGGIYTVTLIVTDNNGCSDTIIQTVSPSVESQASYTYSIDTCEQLVHFFNQSDFALGYLWVFGDGQTSTSFSTEHHYSGDGNYPVLLITNPGTICADTAEYLVDYYLNGIGNVWVPNAFTPNHDGKNDIFEVVGYYPCDDLTFSILDRWGELIYQTTESHITWNGLYQGERVQQGVYVYILEGKRVYQIGTITVFR